MITTARQSDPLYLNVARRLEGLIRDGTLRPGDRVPSVRQLSRQQSVSIPTALHAYLTLENSGWIEARPKSGYYVRPRRAQALPEPAATFRVPTRREIKSLDIAQTLHLDVHNSDVVSLGAACPGPAYLPGEKLARTLGAIARRLGAKSVTYDPAPGAEPMRRELSRRSLTWGCSLPASDFIITGGATEALSIALRATCNPGDTVLIETPTYYGVIGMLQTLNLKGLPVTSYPGRGIDLGEVEKAIRRQKVSVALLITNFSNPSGGTLSTEDKRRLVTLLRLHDIPLIEDDIYGDLQHEGERPCCAKRYDTSDSVLLCGSFSKTLAPGYRVGYLAPGRYYDRALALKNSNNISTTLLSTLAIAEFLKNGGYDHHLRTLRSTYRQNIQRMSEAIAAAFPDGIALSRPQGGFVLWLELPSHIDSIQLFHTARAAGVTIAPGPLFSTDRAYRNFIRLSAGGIWGSDIEQAITTVGKLVQAKC